MRVSFVSKTVRYTQYAELMLLMLLVHIKKQRISFQRFRDALVYFADDILSIDSCHCRQYYDSYSVM